jgi:isopropylmalate/homocitrate/citramalate synthase
MKMKAFGFTREKVKNNVVTAIKHAKSHGIDKVNFFAVDSTRSDLGYLREMYMAALDAGADEVSVVDTIGVCAPETVEYLVREVKSWVGPSVPVHWHGHNDFGLATASAIAAVRGGADWVQGTINGMGERAGNADICEVALALQFLYHVPVEMDLSKAREVSQMVQDYGKYTVDSWKPVVGKYIFCRESGGVAAQFHMPGWRRSSTCRPRSSPTPPISWRPTAASRSARRAGSPTSRSSSTSSPCRLLLKSMARSWKR